MCICVYVYMCICIDIVCAYTYAYIHTYTYTYSGASIGGYQCMSAASSREREREAARRDVCFVLPCGSGSALNSVPTAVVRANNQRENRLSLLHTLNLLVARQACSQLKKIYTCPLIQMSRHECASVCMLVRVRAHSGDRNKLTIDLIKNKAKVVPCRCTCKGSNVQCLVALYKGRDVIAAEDMCSYTQNHTHCKNAWIHVYIHRYRYIDT